MKKILSLFLFVALIGFASAQVVGSDENFFGSRTGTASYVNYGSSFNSYYGSQASTYWPVLSNRDECTASQDILVQVSPAGCQPVVVRSDLIAEQNVPVFCQLDLLQVNPAINVKQIRNIRFGGKYPDYVAGVGFHPANAALRTTNTLLGTPLESNIGYVVVVLKRNSDEKTLPEFFNFTLSASIDYYSGNAVGIGATEMLLRATNDDEWKVAKNKQTLFGGKMSVRVTETESNDSINVELYSGDIKYSEITLRKGQTQPSPVYLPGSYCQTSLQFNYNDFVSPSLIARVQVDDDVLDLYEGSRFLNNKCAVRKVSGDSSKGSVEINCGTQTVKLSNSAKLLNVSDKVYKLKDGKVDTSVEYTVSKVTTDGSGVSYQISSGAGTETISSYRVRPVSQGILIDAQYGDSEKYIANATLSYEAIADLYGNEKKELGEIYGEVSLAQAIRLSVKYGKDNQAARLINKYLDSYPNGKDAIEFTQNLNQIYARDSTLAGTSVQTDDGVHLLKLIDVSGSGKKSSVSISWGEEQKTVEQGTTVKFASGNITLLNIRNADTAEIQATCNSNSRGYKGPVRVRDNSITACGSQIIKVSSIDLQNYFKVRISPITRSGTTTNFTVGIGIEKRAIELTPSKAKKKIENLNESIKKWESISKTLGETVSTLKGACFATAGVLTVKNFFSGLGGEALARRGAMSGDNGWTKFCQNEVNAGRQPSLTACYNSKSSEIAQDVEARKQAIKDTNEATGKIEKDNALKTGEGFFAGESFDDVEARKDLIVKIRDECSDVSLGTRSGNMSYNNVGSLLPANVDAKTYSYSQLRDIYFNCKVLDSGSVQGKLKATTDLDSIGVNVADNLKYQQTLGNYQGAQVYPINNGKPGNYYKETIGSLKTNRGFTLGGSVSLADNVPAQIVKGADNKNYLVTLVPNGQIYTSDKVYELSGANNNVISNEIPTSNLKELPSSFNRIDSAAYNHQFATGETTVRYFETEPYKGMPAIVPFDLNRGFYAATTQSLPIFGGTKSFEDSGRPASFYVCNIMTDKRIGFYSSNYGDDECVQFNMYTGQPLNAFPGLSEDETRRLVSDAKKSLEEAASQYGKSTVRIGTNTFNVGNAASLLPGSQCQDYMSPEECKLLFNVCDPVICPSSRCNFGGEYYVSDVIQSGIVGSALLCLPNVKEGIVVPVCLTGIKAGIDGYLSILKSHQQCLQEAVETGKYVGICDQVSSVYLCEFFWRQVAPLAKVVLPKIVEYAYSGGQSNVRGGGEYLTVQSSWQNAQDSVNYFTQSYAVNSFNAFKIRSIEEAGTEICRAFVSAKVPNSFETLIEPDSPPQFHAWYSSIEYTDATIPATSQYKVFYHIFAGNERGVSYSVYLKDPPASSQYASAPVIVVSTGFAARGQYATESKDFTAPKGYQQLCVRINDKEECGFKQVSSSFAVNYVRDSIVSDELTRNDITTENECISGSVSPAALLNPNLQSGAEEALNPAIYNRGIVRICATDNPGSSTNPARFVKVGVCGSNRLGCWLDKKSVDKSITDANVNLTGNTLGEIEQIQKANLQADERYSSSSDLSNEIKTLDKEINSADSSNIGAVIGKLDALMSKAFWNIDKANILFSKARVFEIVFTNSIDKLQVRGVATDVPSAETPVTPSTATGARVLSFGEKEYTNSARSYIFLNGVITRLYILGEYVYLDVTKVGNLQERQIIFTNVQKKADIEKEIMGDYDLFNSGVITVDNLNKGIDLNKL